MIGKVVIVIFWGFLGYNLVECLTNPLEFVKVFILIAVAYIVARMVTKKFDLDDRMIWYCSQHYSAEWVDVLKNAIKNLLSFFDENVIFFILA